MTETPVSRLILNLGIPTTISMLITSIYNMADTYFVGTLGESAQAATGILFTVQAIMQGLAFMLGHGAGTHVSRSLADRDADKATMYISTSFFTGIGLGLVIGVLGLAFLRPLVHFLGSTDTIAPYAMDYGFWVFLAAPTIICSLILNNGLRYEGKAFYAMIGLTAGGLLNILGDYILVMKLGMGVYGAGLATAASQLVSFVILLIMYLKMAQSTIRFRAVSRNFKIYLSICRVWSAVSYPAGADLRDHGTAEQHDKALRRCGHRRHERGQPVFQFPDLRRSRHRAGLPAGGILQLSGQKIRPGEKRSGVHHVLRAGLHRQLFRYQHDLC